MVLPSVKELERPRRLVDGVVYPGSKPRGEVDWRSGWPGDVPVSAANGVAEPVPGKHVRGGVDPGA